MEPLTWEAPGPGPWQQDKSHLPYMGSRIVAEVFPENYARGFGVGLAMYGALLDRLQPAAVNGFFYVQPQPFDMPGPDGPPSPEWIGAEIGRRTAVAAEAFERRVWNDDLRLWDDELKPAAVAKHVAFHAKDLGAMSNEELCAELAARRAHLGDMIYQHHRFNISALAPVGDFALQAAAMAQMSPVAMFAALDGSSPVSGMVTPDITPCLEAIRASDEAQRLLADDRDPVERLQALRALVPEVDEWLRHTEYKIVDGLDVTRPTMAELPEVALGKLAAALVSPPPEAATQRAMAFAATVRERIPAEQRAHFDDLLLEARRVNRLRDERGVYSDTSAIGLLRLAMLEAGRRLTASGVLADPEEAVEAGLDELTGLLRGESPVTAVDLRARAAMRISLGTDTAPALLGPPPPPPPPVDQLPPPLARVMSSVGFCVDGVLGQLPAPAGNESLVIGIGAGTGVYEGSARVVLDFEDLFLLEPGEVLVTPSTMESFNAMLHLVGAIVTDHGSFASHAAIMARELGFPAVVGTVDGTKRIRTGDRIRVDAAKGDVTVVS